MRIGVTFPQTEFGNDPIALRDYAQTVEGLGFTHFLAYDHVLSVDTANRPGWSGAYSLEHPFHEVFVLLGYVAAVTARLELVTGVLILPQRQTALVAKQAAEVDLLSGGRLRLGVGVGWNAVEFEGLSKDFHDRGARSEEQIALLRALWTAPSITFDGRWERVVEAGVAPLPVQRPIPVWIGGYAEATLRRVGRIGDGWFPWREPNDAMRGAVERLRGYAQDAGRDPASIGLEPQLNVGR
ncbi:MAG: LLM class F420-dependent oxidoreductase, partial [Chloroflexota bacterium]|nr:LLM class F420-dependent oxidoreductase [Chloroflexota bacterium]